MILLDNCTGGVINADRRSRKRQLSRWSHRSLAARVKASLVSHIRSFPSYPAAPARHSSSGITSSAGIGGRSFRLDAILTSRAVYVRYSLILFINHLPVISGVLMYWNRPFVQFLRLAVVSSAAQIVDCSRRLLPDARNLPTAPDTPSFVSVLINVIFWQRGLGRLAFLHRSHRFGWCWCWNCGSIRLLVRQLE